MLRILIAPDKFKGSLNSFEVCDAIEMGLRLAGPAFHIEKLPLADGGVRIHDYVIRRYWIPYPGRSLLAGCCRPMARASGLALLQPSELDCLHATSYGTGQLIGEAIRSGAEEIVIGIGGSATNDGGIGMAAALGLRFLDDGGKELSPSGGSLIHLAKIDVRGRAAWPGIRFRVASDVQNPLCGPQGASRVYAPQKGADPAMVELLEAGMLNYARILKNDLRIDIADTPGAGAAGSMGAGCMAFLGAEMVSGIDLMMEYSRAGEKVQQADLVITGEGKMDAQTLQGKLVGGIAGLGRRYHKPVFAFCGSLELGAGDLRQLGIAVAYPIVNRPMPLEEAMRDAAILLKEAACRAGGLLPGLLG